MICLECQIHDTRSTQHQSSDLKVSCSNVSSDSKDLYSDFSHEMVKMRINEI